MRGPRSNDLVQGEMTCAVQYKAVGVPQADKLMHGRGKVPEHRDVLLATLVLARRSQVPTTQTWVNQHQGTKLCGALPCIYCSRSKASAQASSTCDLSASFH